MKKNHYIAFALILFAYVVASSALLSRGHNWGDDFASYIMQAKSIDTGTEKIFFEQNSFTIHELSNVIGPVAYPWGYPLILSIFYAVFGLNPLALKIPNILFFVLFLIVFYKLLRKRLPPWEGILLVSILAFNPQFFSSQNQILSDIPFLFFSTLSVFLIDRFVSENKEFPPSPINNLILGVSIFWAIFVRTTGIILILTLLLCQIIVIRQQWKEIIKRPRILLTYLLPHFVAGSLWLAFSLILPSGESSYLLQFSSSTFITSLKDNISYYFHLMEQFLTGLPSVQYFIWLFAGFPFNWPDCKKQERLHPHNLFSLYDWPLFALAGRTRAALYFSNHSFIRLLFLSGDENWIFEFEWKLPESRNGNQLFVLGCSFNRICCQLREAHPGKPGNQPAGKWPF